MVFGLLALFAVIVPLVVGSVGAPWTFFWCVAWVAGLLGAALCVRSMTSEHGGAPGDRLLLGGACAIVCVASLVLCAVSVLSTRAAVQYCRTEILVAGGRIQMSPADSATFHPLTGRITCAIRAADGREYEHEVHAFHVVHDMNLGL